MYERILVPLDGSKLAEQVFPSVVELARAFSSEVVLVGVCEPEESEYGQACRLYINNEAKQLRNSMEGSSANVRAVALAGKAAEQIIDYAEKNDVSLIIMASHGRSGIMPWTLGSVANKVLQRIDIPILLIRAKTPRLEAGAQGLFNRILVPLDGSDAGEAILPYARQLTEKLKSGVILLQVVAPGQHVHTIGGLDYVRFTEDHLKLTRADAKQYLEKAGRKLTGTEGIIRLEVKIGDAAQEIIKLADETNTSLIAMSTHGHSGIRQWIFGSVTHKILQAANTPILLAKAPG